MRRVLHPPNIESLALRHTTSLRMQLSEEKFRREPATRQFDESFAALHRSKNRFARQNFFGLPLRFPLASTCPCKGHCPSGLTHNAQGKIIHRRSLPPGIAEIIS